MIGIKLKVSYTRCYNRMQSIWEQQKVKLFNDLKEQKKGQITVFYCGNASLEKVLEYECAVFGFKFKKEIF